MKLTSIRVRHFKAVEDSGTLNLGPLTAFVGYNGTGKSSLMEACEFFQNYAINGLEAALTPWFRFQSILWQGRERKKSSQGPFFDRPFEIEISGRDYKDRWKACLEIGELAEPFRKFDVERYYLCANFPRLEGIKQRLNGENLHPDVGVWNLQIIGKDRSLDFGKWMFLSLNPFEIGQPRRRLESKANEPLLKSGANLADILKSFLDIDPNGFNAMIDALQYIVPYAANVRPEVTQDMVERRSLIQLTERFAKERNVTLPGWVLSGGTLRLLALLAALRHPRGPSVLFIEELENGLDPRAIGFVVEEIRAAVESGEKQVILTTHSPYLLDKLALEHVVAVERPDGGSPVFHRPAEEKELREWSAKFAPGSLYSMGLLRAKERRTR